MEVDDNGKSSYWGTCPAEILILIFKYLDTKDLLSCLFVTKMWRSNADYWGKKSGKWLKLVENLQNKGHNLRQRTKLDYRELYLNRCMWYSVHKAQLLLKHVYDLKEVKRIHVYRDTLIVTCAGSVKFYNIESGTLTREILETCLDYQETDYLVAKIGLKEGKKHLSLYSKLNDKTFKTLGIKLYNIQQNKCYLTNAKSVINFYECTPKGVVFMPLGRYYSNPGQLYALHMYEDDMFIYTGKGQVFYRKNGKFGIPQLCAYNVPSPPTIFDRPTEKFAAIFHKCSVVYGVQNKEKEGIIKHTDSRGEEHLVLLYYGLTCAIQHADILVLGFHVGKVGIVIIKDLWATNDLTPAFQFYIKDLDVEQKVEPIQLLEVYEGDAGHHVIISTKSNLYQVVISHSDYKKVMP